MKTRVLLLVLGAFLSYSGLNAQLRTGIAAGAHLSAVPGNQHPGWDTLNYQSGYRQGFRAGIQVDIPFSSRSNFHFQPAMFYTQKGRSLSNTYDTANSLVARVSGSQFTNYMEMPLNLVYKAPVGKKTRILIGGGPYVSFLYAGREKQEAFLRGGGMESMENTDLKRTSQHGEYQNLDYGVNGLLGLEIGRVFLTANYSRGMKDFYQAFQHPSGSFRHEVMGATLGVYLGKTPEKKTRRRDRDKDGVPDAEDACPTEKGSVATKGCPDRDGDGIADKDDKCPDVAGLPNNQGCPLQDSDGDGVPDVDDPCPLTPGDSTRGCPEISSTIVDEVNIRAGRIQFAYSSSVLTNKAKIALDGIVNILRDNEDLLLTIEGFTSTDGSGHNHLRLSQARANAVQRYLELKGIDPRRLRAVGRGTAVQLNENRTEEERALNRRVELKLSLR